MVARNREKSAESVRASNGPGRCFTMPAVRRVLSAGSVLRAAAAQRRPEACRIDPLAVPLARDENGGPLLGAVQRSRTRELGTRSSVQHGE